MTRKDYVKIAAMLNQIHGEIEAGAWRGPDAANGVLIRVQQDLSVILRADNPRFDVQRFDKACEVQQ